jgi:Fe-S-cluster containining protein
VIDFASLEHERFRRVQCDIFIRRVVADCMSHKCSLLKRDDQVKLDACCSYGVDADLRERDGILRRAEQIRDLLDQPAKDLPWFHDEVQHDPDFPSGSYVRTRTHGGGCIFLAHDQRGCAIHRAADAHGWDFRGVKPHVCRLFPLTYESDAIVLSDDYTDYSCSQDRAAPTLYRVGREALGDIFGEALIQELDRVETRFVTPDVLVGPHTLAARIL